MRSIGHPKILPSQPKAGRKYMESLIYHLSAEPQMTYEFYTFVQKIARLGLNRDQTSSKVFL